MSFLHETHQRIVARHDLMRKAPNGGQIPDVEVAGAPVTGHSLLHLSEPSGFDQGFVHFRQWVYVVVNHIARRIAEQPIRLGQIVRDGQAASERRHRVVPKYIKAQTRLIEDEEIAVINDGALADVLERPNRIQSRYDFVYICVANLLMTGEAYVLGGRTRREENPELWAVPTGWIRPEHEGRLFSGYMLKPHPNREGHRLSVEQVARIYLPDPTDPKGCISPVFTQLRAVHVDDHIQASQEMAFENGIFPSLALHVGRVDGKEKGPRRLLQPHQRRQLIAAVRKIYGGVARSGEPLILDALVEEISQITRAPREMDWNQSAELVRKRIFHAFGMNPINTGEIAGVNRAQAAVAESHQVRNVLNPMLEKLTSMVNSFIVPMFYEPEVADSVIAWFEPCVAMDEEQAGKDWHEGAKMGFVTRNEFRRDRLGLDADTETDQNALLANPQSLNAVTNLVKSVSEGAVPESTAAALLAKFFAIPLDEALAIVRGTGAIGASVRGLRTIKAVIGSGKAVAKTEFLEHRASIVDEGEKEVAALLERFFPGDLH